MISQKELKKIIEKHKLWLIGEPGGQRANLEGVYIEGGNFENLYLEDANFENSILYNVSFNNANLKEAKCKCAYLENAALHEANLEGVDLREASLNGASFRNANLRCANLKGARLENADLNGAILIEADTDKHYYQIGCVGSRKSLTTYCPADDIVLCGCWNCYQGGSLEDFAQRVESIYGENGTKPNNQYYEEYVAAIEFFRAVRKLWEMRK